MNTESGISNLYEDIFKSMNTCKSQMVVMEQTLIDKLNAIGQVKCRCKCTLKQSLSLLKQTFNTFSQEWKIQMPLMLNQFLGITQKISQAYQQKIQELNEEKEKWKFSYQQIVQSFSIKQDNQCSLVEKDEMLEEMMGRQAQNSMFLQQKITQLFDEQDSMPQNYLKERQREENKFYIEQKQEPLSKQEFWSNLNDQIALDISKKGKQNARKTDRTKQKTQGKDEQPFNKLLNIRRSFYSKNRNSFDRRI